MADYDLGTARGKIEVDADGAEYGFGRADAAQEKFTKGSQRSADAMLKTGAVVAGAGLGIAAAFGVAINSAANFEERISGIKAVSGATEEQLEKIRKKALQLGADTKFSATESALAMEELIKAGLTVEDVLNGAADATVNLAAAGEIELPRAAEIAANAMSAFNLAAEDLPHVADLIAGAANASAISVEEFAQAMQQSSAVANLAGFSFDDLAVAIAAMGNAGIKGSDAGTSLKTFLQNLQPVTAKQTALFKELGLIMADGTNAFYDQTGSIKPLADVAQVLQDALAGMTDQQRQMALETLFGSDAIRAAAVIAGEGAAGFGELAEAMGKVTAAEVAETRMDNLKGSIEQLKGSVETMLVVIGQPLAEALRVWVDRLTGLINAFSELDEAQRNDIVTILQMASAFLTTLGAFLIVAGALSKLKLALTAIGLVFGSVGAVAFAIIAVLVAVGAALVVLYQRNETFREAVQKAWEWISVHVLAIINEVQEGITAMIETFNGQGMTSDGLVGVFERIGIAARAVVDWITGTLIPAFQDFVDFVNGTIVPAIQWFASEIQERLDSAFGWLQENVFPVLDAFGEMVVAIVKVMIAAWNMAWPATRAAFQGIAVIVQTAMKVISTVIETVIEIIMTLWNEFGDNLWDVIKLAWNFIVETVSGALQVLKGIFQVITGALTGDWSKLWEGIKNIVGGFWDQIVAIVRLAIGLVGQVIEIGLGLIKAGWSIAWNIITATIENTWNIITGVVKLAIVAVKGSIETGINTIKTIWNAAWEFVKSILKAAWAAITGAVSAGVNTVVTFVAGLPGRILGALVGMGTLLYQKGKDIIQGLQNGITNVWNVVNSWFHGLPAKFVNFLAGSLNWLYQAGKDILQGLWNGLKAKWESISSWVSDRMSDLKGIVTGMLGIGSPSKVFHEYGKMILLGLQNGLAETRGLEGQIEHMVRLVDTPPSAPQLTAGGRGSGGETHIHFHFGDIVGTPEDIEKVLKDPKTLRELANAVRAGSKT